jgi:hypothetical protein
VINQPLPKHLPFDVADVIMESLPHQRIRVGDYWVAGVKRIAANHCRKTLEVHIHFEYPPEENPGLGVAVYSNKGQVPVQLQVGDDLFETVVTEYADMSTICPTLPGFFFEVPNPAPSPRRTLGCRPGRRSGYSPYTER